jgi:hypothetical protein
MSDDAPQLVRANPEFAAPDRSVGGGDERITPPDSPSEKPPKVPPPSPDPSRRPPETPPPVKEPGQPAPKKLRRR